MSKVEQKKIYTYFECHGGGKWSLVESPHLIDCSGPGPMASCSSKPPRPAMYTYTFVGNYLCAECGTKDNVIAPNLRMRSLTERDGCQADRVGTFL
jgi:hypothetical protein